MGGKSGGGSGTTTIQFAPYIEAGHKELLDNAGADILTLNVFRALNSAFNQSPYTSIASPDPNVGYLDSVNLASYPALFRVYDDYIFGVDTAELWDDLYRNAVGGDLVAQAVAAQSTLLQDEIDATITPKMKAGFRDINAVQSLSL